MHSLFIGLQIEYFNTFSIGRNHIIIHIIYLNRLIEAFTPFFSRRQHEFDQYYQILVSFCQKKKVCIIVTYCILKSKIKNKYYLKTFAFVWDFSDSIVCSCIIIFAFKTTIRIRCFPDIKYKEIRNKK